MFWETFISMVKNQNQIANCKFGVLQHHYYFVLSLQSFIELLVYPTFDTSYASSFECSISTSGL